MRHSALGLLIVLPVVVTPAQPTDKPPDTKQHAGDQKPSVLAHSDAEIVALLMNLHDNEIGAAKLAMTKNVDQKVAALANSIEQDHRKDKNETSRVATETRITPKATPASRDLLMKGKDTLRSLGAQEGPAFQKVFVSETVKGQRDALLMLDGFLETAQNDELKAHLDNVRQHVALHLQEAERLNTASAAQ